MSKRGITPVFRHRMRDLRPRWCKQAMVTGGALLVLALGARAALGQAMDQPGAWRHFRGDDRLTGRSGIKGRITQPAILWRFDTRSRETLLEARLEPGASGSATLPGADISRPPGFDRQWGLGGPWMDLEGDGVLRPVGAQVGDVLRGVPGLERFEVGPNANRDGPSVARLFGREGGRWVERWKRPQSPDEDWTEGLVAASVPIAGDFDGDGRFEIAFQGFSWVYVIDAETGRLEAKTRFLHDGEAESGRGYGWFGAEDLDGDGKAEFVLIGDTQNLVAVVGWDARGRFARRWIKVLNFDAYRRISLVKPGVDPLHDLNGDGIKEIVFSVFNHDPATGRADDHRWHTWALSGRTGAAQLDLKDEVLAGLRDLDGDGASEILTTHAPGQLVPRPSTLSIFSFKNDRLARRWQLEGETFELTARDVLRLDANSSAAGERLDLLAGAVAPGGSPVFFTGRVLDPELPTIRVTVWQSGRDGVSRAIGRISGPDLEIISVRPATDGPSILVRARSFDERAALTTENLSARPVASMLGKVPMSPVTVGRLVPGDCPAVVVEGASERVVAFSPYALAGRVRFRKPGRGMSTGGGHSIGWSDRGGVVLADLSGDGTLATIAATSGPSGNARLVAYNSRGALIWHHDFREIPGKIPAHNVEGLSMWFSGRFTDSKRYDILVTPRPKSQEEAVLLRGTDGAVLWTRERVGLPGEKADSRPVGGTWIAAADHDGDGCDDVIAMYPDLFYALDGRTGSLLVSVDSQSIFPDAPIKPYNAIPVAADFRGEGSLQYLWGACDRAFGLLDGRARVIWQERRPLPAGRASCRQSPILTETAGWNSWSPPTMTAAKARSLAMPEPRVESCGSCPCPATCSLTSSVPSGRP